MIGTGGIYKGGITVAAILPVAAAAVASKGATLATSQPVVWHFLGYPFEAASMIAAVFACSAARFWIGAAQAVRQQHRWAIDIPVTGMVLATSAALIMAKRPEPLGALLYGGGLGVMGEGIFKVAEHYLRKAGAVFGIEPDSAGRV